MFFFFWEEDFCFRLFCCCLRLLPLLSAAAFTGFSLVPLFTHTEAERDHLGGEDGL